MTTAFRRHRMMLAAAAMIASGAVFAQSPMLTAPNNSAGTPLDTPPMVTQPAPLTGMPTRTESAVTAFDRLDSTDRGYVMRSETDKLPGTINFGEADRNRDGRLDQDEFQRFWNDYQGGQGQ